MTDAVIVSTARTPLCKSWRGALNMTHGATMGGHVVKHALERAKLDTSKPISLVTSGMGMPLQPLGWPSVTSTSTSCRPGLAVARLRSSPSAASTAGSVGVPPLAEVVSSDRLSSGAAMGRSPMGTASWA